jgi:putative FmdB family regulatory protein
MPLYEYRCKRHGVFERMTGMSESGRPAACPRCDKPAKRILSPVRGAQMAATEVRARDRNERSAHEPKVVQAKKKPLMPGERPKLQSSHTSRPWALEHG